MWHLNYREAQRAHLNRSTSWMDGSTMDTRLSPWKTHTHCLLAEIITHTHTQQSEVSTHTHYQKQLAINCVCNHLCRLDKLWGSRFVVRGWDANLQQHTNSKESQFKLSDWLPRCLSSLPNNNAQLLLLSLTTDYKCAFNQTTHFLKVELKP